MDSQVAACGVAQGLVDAGESPSRVVVLVPADRTYRMSALKLKKRSARVRRGPL